MASTGTPLGIGLSIDFARLDSDLSKVANKIDKVGSETTLKVGTLSGMSDKGKGLDVDHLSAQMGRVGVSLANGMASGVGVANAMLLKITARIAATVDQIGEMMTKMFSRIDVAMKGHRWTNLLTGLSNSLGSFAGGGKARSMLDKAMGGSFGGMAKTVSRIFNDLFEKLSVTISKSMDKAAKSMGESMDGASKKMATSFKPTLETIDNSFKRMTDRMVTTMLHAIDMMIVKMKGFGSQSQVDLSKIGAAMTAAEYRAKKAADQLKSGAKPERAKPPIMDVETKLKPPPAAVLHRFAKGIAEGMGEMPLDLTKMFKEKTKVKLPPLPKSTEPAPPKGSVMPPRVPQPSGFHPPMALEPEKFGGIVGAVKAALETIKKIPAAIGKIPTAFGAAVDSGNKFAVAVAIVGRAFYEVGSAAAMLVKVTARIAAGASAMGLSLVAAIGRSISFFQTLGSVGKVTYVSLFRDNNFLVAGMLATIKTVYHLGRGLLDLVTLRAFRRVGDDATQAKGAVGALTGSVGKLLGSVGRLGVEMAAAFGVVGLVYKTVQFFQKGVKSAADLNAEVARSKVVFGESFGDVEAQVEKNAKAFKISKAAQMELTSSFGSMAQGAGVSEVKSADLATELNSLAIDMTGLGVSFTEASEAMKTGLSGRAISLKQFSVNIDENTTKSFAWKTGIAAVGQELTMQQTLLARAGQMMRGLSYAQGALTAGANQASVQFQRAGGGIALFAEKIGEILLPSVQSATKRFDALLGGVLNMVETAGPSIQSWSMSASGVVDTFIEKTQEFGPTILQNLTWAWAEAKKGPLGFVIEGTEAVMNFAKAIPEAIGIGIRNMGTLWEIAKLRVGDFVNNAIAYIQTIPANFGIIFPWILKNWQTLLVDLGEALKTIGGNLLENARNLGAAVWEALKGGEFKFVWTPLLEGFKATTEKLPDLIKPAIISSQAEIDRLYKKIGENELNVKVPKSTEAGAAGNKQPPLDQMDKGKEYKLGGALESGTKEAFSAISKGQSGRGSTTDAVKQGVAVQREHLAISKQQLAAMQNSAKMPAIAIK